MAPPLNPALEPLDFLIGDWLTIGTHPLVPGEALHGRTSFAWLDGGAFLIMRQSVDHPLFPTGVAIIGSDGDEGRFAMTYFDERGVSRLYDVVVGDGTMTWRRDDPVFSQSMRLAASEGGRLLMTGRMSQHGSAWTEDLSQTFTRMGKTEMAPS